MQRRLSFSWSAFDTVIDDMNTIDGRDIKDIVATRERDNNECITKCEY